MRIKYNNQSTFNLAKITDKLAKWTIRPEDTSGKNRGTFTYATYS